MCYFSEPAEEIDVPVSEPVIAYRAYNIGSNNRLISTSVAATVAKVTKSECRCGRELKHARPSRGGSCGIHAFATPEALVAAHIDGVVTAVVAIWGRIVKHGTRGYRAEYAKPLRLALHDFRHACPCTQCERWGRALPAIARFYEAEVVSEAALLAEVTA